MKRLALCVLVVVLGACNAVENEDVEPEPLDLSMAKFAAIEYALGVSDLGTKDLVYVAGPSLQMWEQWCGFDTGERGEDPHDQVPSVCDVLIATSFDLPAIYPSGSDSAAEIEAALAPATVDFVEDRESVIEPFGEGMMVAPIKNDAGLLTIGVLIEADGKVYLPVDAHGQGWLFELSPTRPEGGAWDITPISEYIA